MTKDEALKIALDYVLRTTHWTEGRDRHDTLKAIKEALAQPERHELQTRGEHPAPCARHCEATAFQIVIRGLKAQLSQPEQEVDWKDLYEKEKRRSAMWLAKLEEVVGPSPKVYPLSQPEQEPIYLVWLDEDMDRKWSETTKDHYDITDEEERWLLYTAPPKREWVGLTDEERNYCVDTPFVSQQWMNIEAKLKEKNT